MNVKSARRAALVISLLVVAGGLRFAWSVHRRQLDLKELTGEIEKWGGQVVRRPNTNPSWDRLRKVFGNRAVDAIAGIDGYYLRGPMNRAVDRDQLRQLLEFRPILAFDAKSATNIDDDWFGRIRDPSSIEKLELDCTQVSDRSVPKILEMKNLRELSIDAAKFSDEAIDRLILHPRLRRIEVGGANFRSIRLLEAWPADGSNSPTRGAGRATQIRGRIAIDPRLGKPRAVQLVAYQPGSVTKGFAGGEILGEADAPGVSHFQMRAIGLPPGRSVVQGRIEVVPEGSKVLLSCRLQPTTIELDGPGPGD